MDYVEVAVNGPGNRNRIIPVSNIRLLYGNHETYRSYFTFDSSRAVHAETGGTSKDYRGALGCGLGHVWDIDTPTSMERGMELAHMLYSKLVGLGVPEEYIKIYYSGSKGFHVAIPDLFGFEPNEFVYYSVLKTMTEFFPDADRMIYTRTGLIRLPYTVHGKTGRYKIQIVPSDLLGSSDDIINLSRSPDEAKARISYPPISREDLSLYLEDFKVDADPRPLQASAYTHGSENIPDYLTCMFHLERDGAKTGERHESSLRLAAAYHHRGIPKASALQILTAWAEMVSTVDDPFTEEDVVNAVEWAYSREQQTKFRCEDHIMQQTCDPHCKLYKKLHAEGEFSMQQLAQQYVHDSMEKRTSFSLNEIGWNGVGFRMRSREIVLIAGDTKLGKSSLAWNWIVRLPHLRILYCGPEMSPTHVFEKLVQIKHNKQIRLDRNVNEIRPMIADGSLMKAAEGLKHIQISGHSPSLEWLRKTLSEGKYDIVIIDPYESLFSEAIHDLHPDKVANELRDIVNDSNAICICVVHISKSGQRENKSGDSIEAWMIKGHKRIQEQSDHILAFEGTSGSVMRKLRLLRGRNAQDLDIALKGNPYTQRFYLGEQPIH